MRSIGKWNIKKLNKIIDEEYKSNIFGSIDLVSIRTAIESRIPEAWYSSWECAEHEIARLIDDGLSKRYYQRSGYISDILD